MPLAQKTVDNVLTKTQTGEINDLKADAGDLIEKSGRRQNRGGDAYKQERQLDQDLADEGAIWAQCSLYG